MLAVCVAWLGGAGFVSGWSNSPSTHMAIRMSSRRTSTCLPTLILIFPARVHSSSSPVKSSIEPAFSDDHMLIDEYGSEYTSTFFPRQPLRVTNNQKPIDHCIIRTKPPKRMKFKILATKNFASELIMTPRRTTSSQPTALQLCVATLSSCQQISAHTTAQNKRAGNR